MTKSEGKCASTGALVALTVAALAMTGSCTHDQTYSAHYLFANQSSVDVYVEWGSEYFYSLAEPIYVPAGDTKEIAYYEEFIGPPPDAAAHFTCISARRATDDVLVYQRTRPENRIWRIRDLSEYSHEFTLEMTDERLAPNGIANRCGQLEGTMIDSLTMTPLDLVNVVFEDSIPNSIGMQCQTRDGSNYSLIWSGEMRRGTIKFFRHGYRRKFVSAPADVEVLGDSRYQLDAALVPDSIR